MDPISGNLYYLKEKNHILLYDNIEGNLSDFNVFDQKDMILFVQKEKDKKHWKIYKIYYKNKFYWIFDSMNMQFININLLNG